MGGCFWCMEAVFQRREGVRNVVSGYAGGDDESNERPSYDEVGTGQTQWAEAVKVWFDPSRVSYGKLLDTFFKAHDPTTLNKQGGDEGPQYRSAIFYTNAEQKQEAQAAIQRARQTLPERKDVVGDDIVTEVSEVGKFWNVVELGENYHHNFYNKCVIGDCYHPGYNKH